MSRILLGVIGRPHGVRGLVRVTSYTDPPEALASYRPLLDGRGRQFALYWRGDGLAEIAELGGREARITDRSAAERLVNTRLFVERDHLPRPDSGEFYVADLIGLAAMDLSGKQLGEIVAVHEYGAGASLEIARSDAPPLLVPFSRTAVPEVALGAGFVVVRPPVVIETAAPEPAATELAE